MSQKPILFVTNDQGVRVAYEHLRCGHEFFKGEFAVAGNGNLTEGPAHASGRYCCQTDIYRKLPTTLTRSAAKKVSRPSEWTCFYDGAWCSYASDEELLLKEVTKLCDMTTGIIYDLVDDPQPPKCEKCGRELSTSQGVCLFADCPTNARDLGQMTPSQVEAKNVAWRWVYRGKALDTLWPAGVRPEIENVTTSQDYTIVFDDNTTATVIAEPVAWTPKFGMVMRRGNEQKWGVIEARRMWNGREEWKVSSFGWQSIEVLRNDFEPAEIRKSGT
jgi:hypothetical protein